MKILFLCLFPLLLSAEEYSTDTGDMRYLEEVNYRLNNLFLLQEISDNLKIIRCQNEESDYCDHQNEKEEEG